MLEHLQLEFKWEKVVAILESAADVARAEKANTYQDVRSCQDSLREIRRESAGKFAEDMEEELHEEVWRYLQDSMDAYNEDRCGRIRRR